MRKLLAGSAEQKSLHVHCSHPHHVVCGNNWQDQFMKPLTWSSFDINHIIMAALLGRWQLYGTASSVGKCVCVCVWLCVCLTTCARESVCVFLPCQSVKSDRPQGSGRMKHLHSNGTTDFTTAVVRRMLGKGTIMYFHATYVSEGHLFYNRWFWIPL